MKEKEKHNYGNLNWQIIHKSRFIHIPALVNITYIR